MNQKIRKLIQKLGEAIHESVSESEQIAGVVEDIRRHGYEVMLMLEATIGLNELEEQPAEAPSAPRRTGKKSRSAAAFTDQDLHFLRSLRISLEGEGGAGASGPDQGPEHK